MSAPDLASALIAALESNTVTPAVAENNVVYRILIAEDNMVNQKLAMKILEKYGHIIEVAENGQLAVDCFIARCERNEPYDIILVSPMRILGLPCRSFSPDGCVNAFHGWYGGH